jgi:26S proteasome non-ATPase regulatory subunit 9
MKVSPREGTGGRDAERRLRMAEIGEAAPEASRLAPPAPAPRAAPTARPDPADPVEPFAAVQSVAPSSPAAAAGLRAGDLILNFGPAHANNHTGLRRIAAVVAAAHAASGGVEVRVMRGRAVVEVVVWPGEWGGRGVLGGHVVPHEFEE